MGLLCLHSVVLVASFQNGYVCIYRSCSEAGCRKARLAVVRDSLYNEGYVDGYLV